jgi:hypothetical protein
VDNFFLLVFCDEWWHLLCDCLWKNCRSFLLCFKEKLFEGSFGNIVSDLICNIKYRTNYNLPPNSIYFKHCINLEFIKQFKIGIVTVFYLFSNAEIDTSSVLEHCTELLHNLNFWFGIGIFRNWIYNDTFRCLWGFVGGFLVVFDIDVWIVGNLLH